MYTSSRILRCSKVVIIAVIILLVTYFYTLDMLFQERVQYVKRQLMSCLTMDSTTLSSTFLMKASLMIGFTDSVRSAQSSSSITYRQNYTFNSYCPHVSPLLVGRTNVSNNVAVTSMESLESAHSRVMLLEPGGRYKPTGCVANHRVAIIIPFRNREKHLRVFLQHMHPFLQRQQIEYRIYVIEQSNSSIAPFNRAALLNIGVVEVLKLTSPPFSCFIFHDVDLLPEDDRNTYSCLDEPRHMSVAVNTMNYTLPYETIFGGVSAMTKEHFFLVNGFSNFFWGWGGEDDDMFERIQYHNLNISRYSPEIARYTMLSHGKALPNPERFEVRRNGSDRYSTDGLNSLNYTRLDLQMKPLYTHIAVDLSSMHLLFQNKTVV